MRVVVPSKGRSQTIRKHTLALFPDATVLVDEAEADEYAKVVDAGSLLTHAGLTPVVRILNWVLDNVHDDVVVIVDDDVTALVAMVGWRPRRYHEPDVARQVLESAAQCTIDAGLGLFGFNQNLNPLYFQEPFLLSRWVGGVIGFVGDHGLRYDENCALHEDADLALQALLRHRVIWCENRWHFEALRFTNPGGNTGYRTAAREAEERAYLKAKWGRYISFTEQTMHHARKARGIDAATTVMTGLRVPRRQLA